MVQSRASKGTVSVESFRGRLRLRWRVAAKQYTLSMSLDDTPGNRQIAQAKARLIESDIIYERFDPTLNKYRPEHFRLVDSSDQPKQVPKLDELWEKFVEYKRPQCSPSTMVNQYRYLTNYLERMPFKSLDESSKARDWIVANLPLESGRRFIVRLSACCDWAMQSKLIDSNPFQGMAKSIKKPKSETDEGFSDINPFTREERDRIIEAFREDAVCPRYSRVKHSHYYPYIWFLFNTGCRPNEAIALRWKDIDEGFTQITFNRAAVRAKGGTVEKSGLKTQKRRIFRCNSKMRDFLASIKPDDCNLDGLLFPAPSGSFMNVGNFRNRVWEPVIKALGIEYRKPYQTRHTFITLALENGMVVHDVARAVGNSPEIIYKHYVGNRRDIDIPEF